MKIDVTGGNGRHICITVPTGLVLNRLTAGVLANGASKQGVSLTRAQLIALICALRECRRRHTDWKIVEVESADGKRVEITL